MKKFCVQYISGWDSYIEDYGNNLVYDAKEILDSDTMTFGQTRAVLALEVNQTYECNEVGNVWKITRIE